jgi:hypothetical protein
MARLFLIASALAGLAGCRDEDSLAESNAHLESAYARFDAGDFDVCLAFCQLILSKDPEYTVARELAEDAAMMKDRQAADVLKHLHVREIANGLCTAIDQFNFRDFDGCIATSNWVLSREPGNVVAERLAEYAAAVKEEERHYEILRERVCEWGKSMRGD